MYLCPHVRLQVCKLHVSQFLGFFLYHKLCNCLENVITMLVVLCNLPITVIEPCPAAQSICLQLNLPDCDQHVGHVS